MIDIVRKGRDDPARAEALNYLARYCDDGAVTFTGEGELQIKVSPVNALSGFMLDMIEIVRAAGILTGKIGLDAQPTEIGNDFYLVISDKSDAAHVARALRDKAHKKFPGSDKIPGGLQK